MECGGGWDNCNSIINKYIFFKKTLATKHNPFVSHIEREWAEGSALSFRDSGLSQPSLSLPLALHSPPHPAAGGFPESVDSGMEDH